MMKTRVEAFAVFAGIVVGGAMLLGGCGSNVVTPPSGSQPVSQPDVQPDLEEDIPIKSDQFDGRVVMDRAVVASTIARSIARADIDEAVVQLSEHGYVIQPRHSLLVEGSIDSELSSMLLVMFLNRDDQRMAMMAIAEMGDDRIFGVSVTDHAGVTPVDVPLDAVFGKPSEARWNNDQKSDFVACVVSRITSDVGSCVFACTVANLGWGGCMVGCVGITGVANVVGCITLVNVRTNMGRYDPKSG
jgi:hypothetical protein